MRKKLHSKTKQKQSLLSLVRTQSKDKKILLGIVCIIGILLVVLHNVTFFPKDSDRQMTIEAEPLTEEQMASLNDEDIPEMQLITKPISVFASSYDSEGAKLHFDFKRPLYVTETTLQYEQWLEGRIVISTTPGGIDGVNDMTIAYGIPEIQGKGGACPEVGYTTKTILGQQISVCDDVAYFGLSAGYPKHPNGGIEYFVFIGGDSITKEDYLMYKDILYSGMRFQ